MHEKTIDLIAEDQFLYNNPQDVEAAIAAKAYALQQKGITFHDGRKSDINYYKLPDGHHVVYKPDLQGYEIVSEYQRILAVTINNSIIVAAKIIPPEAHFKIFVREGAGTNNIPKAQAAKDGHIVVNCPGVNSKVTSNNTLNALAQDPHIQRFVDMAMSGEASALNLKPLYGESPEVNEPALDEQVKGKRITVLGAGDIGTQTIIGLLNSVADKVVVYSTTMSKQDWKGRINALPETIRHKLVIAKSLDDACKGSDGLIEHVPLSDNPENSTRNLITESQPTNPDRFLVF